MTTDPFKLLHRHIRDGEETIYSIEQALAALDSIRDRYLPLEMLPDGWHIATLIKDHLDLWLCRIEKTDTKNNYQDENEIVVSQRIGKTPDAAFLAAVKAIGDVIK